MTAEAWVSVVCWEVSQQWCLIAERMARPMQLLEERNRAMNNNRPFSMHFF